MYSSFLSLTSVLVEGGGVVNDTPQPLYPRKKDTLYEAGWAPGPAWTGAKNLVPTGIRLPDRPARGKSLCHLRYAGSIRNKMKRNNNSFHLLKIEFYYVLPVLIVKVSHQHTNCGMCCKISIFVK